MLAERLSACPSSTGGKGGNVLLWQHMFWFYSHPAVYIMILPGMGMISEIIPVFSRKPIFGYKAIAYSTSRSGCWPSWSGRTTCSPAACSPGWKSTS